MELVGPVALVLLDKVVNEEDVSAIEIVQPDNADLTHAETIAGNAFQDKPVSIRFVQGPVLHNVFDK
jgi:hypothetical protein